MERLSLEIFSVHSNYRNLGKGFNVIHWAYLEKADLDLYSRPCQDKF